MPPDVRVSPVAFLLLLLPVLLVLASSPSASGDHDMVPVLFESSRLSKAQHVLCAELINLRSTLALAAWCASTTSPPSELVVVLPTACLQQLPALDPESSGLQTRVTAPTPIPVFPTIFDPRRIEEALGITVRLSPLPLSQAQGLQGAQDHIQTSPSLQPPSHQPSPHLRIDADLRTSSAPLPPLPTTPAAAAALTMAFPPYSVADLQRLLPSPSTTATSTLTSRELALRESVLLSTAANSSRPIKFGNLLEEMALVLQRATASATNSLLHATAPGRAFASEPCQRLLLSHKPHSIDSVPCEAIGMLFLDNVKAGSTSVRKFLRRHFNCTWGPWVPPEKRTRGHMGRSKSSETKPGALLAWSVVRSPVSRFVSGWKQAAAATAERPELSARVATWSGATVRAGIRVHEAKFANEHFQSQVHRIHTLGKGGMPHRLDFIASLENATADIQHLAAQAPGLTASQRSTLSRCFSGHSNSKAAKLHYIDEAFESERNLWEHWIHDQYYTDFICFGY